MSRCPQHQTPCRRVRPRGFTMIEAVLSMMVVSVAAVATLQILPIVVSEQRRTDEQLQAMLLVTEIISELNSAAFAEPGSRADPMGPEEGETTRAHFDDVDDYEGLDESPPATRLGDDRTDLSGWRRGVDVRYADPVTLTATASESSVKLVRIRVWHDGRAVLSRTVVVSRSWREASQGEAELLTINGEPAADYGRVTIEER